MTDSYFPEAATLRAVAYHVGERIDVRRLAPGEALAEGPLALKAGKAGLAVVFRYGAVGLIGLEPLEEAAFFESLRPFVSAPFDEREFDEAEIHLDARAEERVTPDGAVLLHEASVERLQIVAHVLAKSAVLAHYESGVTGVLDRIEPLAERLQRGGRGWLRDRQVLAEIGRVLLIQTRTVGRVQVSEQPEMTWDRPDLERLYARLADEYDLRERDLILERKLGLISRTAETLLELLQNRRILRVEWYIVALIAVEVALLLYDLFPPT